MGYRMNVQLIGQKKVTDYFDELIRKGEFSKPVKEWTLEDGCRVMVWSWAKDWNSILDGLWEKFPLEKDDEMEKNNNDALYRVLVIGEDATVDTTEFEILTNDQCFHDEFGFTFSNGKENL